jgi:glycerol-3-phosphate acyltransferase PlsY
MTTFAWFSSCLAAYALGCINAAYYWARLRHGIDIRRFGSGTAGARNIGRRYGMRGFVLILILDAALGALAVGIGLALAGPESLLPGCCALLAVIGHVFPVQLKGRGGKGVAKALGALTTLLLTHATVYLWLVVPCLFVFLLFTNRKNLRRYIQKLTPAK